MDRTSAVFVTEALRAGVPTRLSTRELPDLRKNLTQSIGTDLISFERGTIPQGKILWGQYGQGKTHALTAIEHMALDRNFAVSRVSLSREVSCHNLFNFYGSVAERIKTPDSTLEGIQHYLNRFTPAQIKEAGFPKGENYENILPAIVFEDYFYSEGEDKDKLYGDLTGTRLPIGEVGRIHRASRGTPMPKTKFKVTEHARAYFGVMADAISFCGFEGWVILIDEVELIGRLGKVSRLKAYDNLTWLLNWSSEMKYPIYTVVAAATRLQDDLWYGKKNDDRTIMPELARMKYGEDFEKRILNFFEKAPADGSLKILPALNEDLVPILEKIAHLHGIAYNRDHDFDARSLINHLGTQPVRTYIRACLEYLDLQHLYNREYMPETSHLEEMELAEDDEYVGKET